MNVLGKEPYQFEPTETEDDFATVHPAPTSAQDGLDPLQVVLVLICMCTHTNEQVVQLALCGGGCVVVTLCSILCGVCACTSACVTVCSDCDVRVWCGV